MELRIFALTHRRPSANKFWKINGTSIDISSYQNTSTDFWSKKDTRDVYNPPILESCCDCFYFVGNNHNHDNTADISLSLYDQIAEFPQSVGYSIFSFTEHSVGPRIIVRFIIDLNSLPENLII